MVTTTTGIATEFIQFTRASNATVTDSDGKIKWAPHNLLLASEQFDSASWNSSANSTVTANNAVAPNSSTTADTIAFLTDGYRRQTLSLGSSISGITLSFGVWLWTATGKATILLRMTGSVTGTDEVEQLVNLTATPTLYTITRTFTSSDTGVTFGLDNRTLVGGDGIAGNVIAWGAHLYRSDLGGMQANTSAYPMYNPTTPKNLLGYTEDFSNAAWSKPNVTVTVNSVLAPNGIQTADLLTENTVNAGHWAFQSITTIASPLTASAYFKAGSRTWAFIRITDSGSVNRHVWFDLSSGSVGTTETGITASIVSVGDGWYRCRATIAAALAGSNSIVFAMSTGNGVSSYTGDGTSGIYLWGAQLSDSASLDSYVPVYGAAVTSAAYYGPRRDFDPVTLACKGLLVEEQRANLLTYSEDFNGAGWSKTNITNTPASTTSPVGLVNGSKIEATTTAATTFARTIAVSATAASFSVYVKKGSAATDANKFGIRNSTTSTNLLQFTVDYDTGVITYTTGSTGAAVTNAGGGWWRVSGSVSSGITSGDSLVVWLGFWGSSETAGEFAYMWGAQLEAGSFATSYIPTGAATATRSADVASVSTQAFPYSNTEGTMVAAFIPQASATVFQVALSLNPVVAGSYAALLASGGAGWYAAQVNAGTATTGVNKLGAAFNSSGAFGASLNGGAVASSTSSDWTGTSTSLVIGNRSDTIRSINGHIRQITYLPRRISNTELQTRTA